MSWAVIFTETVELDLLHTALKEFSSGAVFLLSQKIFDALAIVPWIFFFSNT